MRTCVLLVVLLLSLPVCADEQQTFFYEYDAAGNITGVRAVQLSGAPIVDSIQPDFLNRDALVSFTVTGSNLSAVAVSTPEPSLSISALQHVSDTEVRFSLFTTDAPLGAASLVFTNLLGSAVQAVTISERLPLISTSPSPLIIANGQSTGVVVRIDQAFTENKTLRVSVSDTSIAALDGSVNDVIDLPLPAGSTELSVEVDGLAVGQTELLIHLIEDSLTNTVSVSVLGPVELPDGLQFIAARAVGVRFSLPQGTSINAASNVVGVRLNSPAISAGERIYSTPVGVNVPME